MLEIFARALYSAALRLATPAYLLRLWWRGVREPVYRQGLAERVAWFSRPPGQQVGPPLWVHAVSLGETLAAAPLLQALRAQRPGLRLLLTHSTATGMEAGAKLLNEGDTQAWLPYDTPGAVSRFLRHHRPMACVLMETEVWPNLQAKALQIGLPTMLVNARLSERSERKAMRLAVLLRPAVASLSRVLAQTQGDALRFKRVGAVDVRVCGNLKFDITPSAKLVAMGHQWRRSVQPDRVHHGQHEVPRQVVLAAVTREGEEAELLQVWRELPAPRPLLVVVPRHPQRFDEVARLVQQAGLSLWRRSQWRDGPPPQASLADVWLGDSMREMPIYYAVADVALLGGSFAPLGGQNLIEAAACGCPLVMGPHTFNFAQAAQWALDSGAAIRAADMREAVTTAVRLAQSPERNHRVKLALNFASEHRGAAERQAAEIGSLLPPA